MNSMKRLMYDHFEAILVVVLVLAAALTVLVLPYRLAFLNFFYIPVLVAAYQLGRNKGMITALVAVLLIVFFAVIDPELFAGGTLADPFLNLFLWGAFLTLTAYVVGTVNDSRKRTMQDLYNAYEGIIEILAKFIDAVDGYTQNHSARVADLACQIAREYGLSETECESVRVAGLLHDVGKIDVNIDVLTKASSLSPEEWEHMMTHTSAGPKLLEPVGGLLENVLPIIYFHHESYDGSGYYGAAGEQIPIGARILAVADSYDSMITDRPYRTGRTPWEAKLEVDEHSGKQFDPMVVKAFMNVLKEQVQYA